MSSKHQRLSSPTSPLSSRQNSSGPSSQYHAPTTTSQHQRKPSPPTPAVSPLSAHSPDSPPRDYLSPVSIASPELSFPPELLHHTHQHATPAAAAAAGPEVPQTVHLARGRTLHLQDHVPFKQPAAPARIIASTRFPARKAVIERREPVSAGTDSREEEDECGPSPFSSKRPTTTYLSDHQPHLLAAAAPTTTRPSNPNNDNPTSTHRPKPPGPTFHSTSLQDIELGNIPITTSTTATKTAPTIPITESPSSEALYEAKRRRRNCVLGCVFGPALVAVIVAFAVLVVRANRP